MSTTGVDIERSFHHTGRRDTVDAPPETHKHATAVAPLLHSVHAACVRRSQSRKARALPGPPPPPLFPLFLSLLRPPLSLSAVLKHVLSAECNSASPTLRLSPSLFIPPSFMALSVRMRHAYLINHFCSFYLKKKKKNYPFSPLHISGLNLTQSARLAHKPVGGTKKGGGGFEYTTNYQLLLSCVCVCVYLYVCACQRDVTQCN